MKQNLVLLEARERPLIRKLAHRIAGRLECRPARQKVARI